MAYIFQCKDRFYVVAYDGVDATTGRERRRWHPAGHARTDVEAIKTRLEAVDQAVNAVFTEQLTLGRYLTERWMPRRQAATGPTVPATLHRPSAHLRLASMPRAGSRVRRYVIGDVDIEASARHTELTNRSRRARSPCRGQAPSVPANRSVTRRRERRTNDG